MEQQDTPLLLSDPPAFMAAVLAKTGIDEILRLRTLDDQMTGLALRHGLINDVRALPDLARFYSESFLSAPIERRKAIYRHVAGIVPQLGADTAGAFMPFILLDTDIGIVSTATVDYTSVGSLFDGDPLTRPRDVADMVTKGLAQNPAAVIGGLLTLGDPRVCEILKPLRKDLDDVDASAIANCGSGSLAKCTVEFFLDWLDELVDRSDDPPSLRIFGAVAAALHNIVSGRKLPFVWGGLRPFPAAGHEAEWAAREKIVPVAFSAQIADRLYDLERREHPPRVMPRVIRACDLTPRTQRSEEAVPSSEIPAGHVVSVKVEWWNADAQVFISWGVLNPNGPTLYVLGSRSIDGKHRTFVRWLHMLGGSTTYAAEARDDVTYQGVYDDALSIHQHLVSEGDRGLFQVIPAFVIANGGDAVLSDVTKRLIANGEAANDDWGREMAYLRNFGSDFFGRLFSEARSIYDQGMAEARATGQEPSHVVKWIKAMHEHTPDFQNAKALSWTPEHLSPAVLAEWWQILSSRQFQSDALVALRDMWEGGADQLPEEMRKATVPWRSVARFIEGIGLRLSPYPATDGELNEVQQ